MIPAAKFVTDVAALSKVPPIPSATIPIVFATSGKTSVNFFIAPSINPIMESFTALNFSATVSIAPETLFITPAKASLNKVFTATPRVKKNPGLLSASSLLKAFKEATNSSVTPAATL